MWVLYIVQRFSLPNANISGSCSCFQEKAAASHASLQKLGMATDLVNVTYINYLYLVRPVFGFFGKY